ncbi:MAG: FAD-binding protein [Actinomycetota bacterium]|nr:FAD-binding protein [Actinomycetota bacterium]
MLLPAAAAYPAAARLYNPRFDAQVHPAAIALCASAADVTACVRFAAAGGAPLRLRAGGHSYGGWSTGEGLIADVSHLSTVSVDTASGLARIGAGARLVDVYTALGARGVAIAAGSCPTVGITGLTLGGGIGVLARAFGLTCDALRSVQIVTADGRLREVDATADPDLFWALRGGGGGSFGAVTALTMAVRPAPNVQTFFLDWDLQHGESVLGAWQGWMSNADNRLWSTCKLLADPGRGAQHARVAGTWIGPARDLPAQLSALRSRINAPPASASGQSLDYTHAMLLEAGCSRQTAEQCVVDALSPAKRQPFAATSAILAHALPAEGITAAVQGARAGLEVANMVEGGVSFDALGGAVAAVSPGATAFVHRPALASMQYAATWASMSGPAGPVSTAPFDAYVRSQRSAMARWTGPGAYANYADPQIRDYGTAYWGANYPRLQAVKKHYDPHNLFTFPQAVRG